MQDMTRRGHFPLCVGRSFDSQHVFADAKSKLGMHGRGLSVAAWRPPQSMSSNSSIWQSPGEKTSSRHPDAEAQACMGVCATHVSRDVVSLPPISHFRSMQRKKGRHMACRARKEEMATSRIPTMPIRRIQSVYQVSCNWIEGKLSHSHEDREGDPLRCPTRRVGLFRKACAVSVHCDDDEAFESAAEVFVDSEPCRVVESSHPSGGTPGVGAPRPSIPLPKVIPTSRQRPPLPLSPPSPLRIIPRVRARRGVSGALYPEPAIPGLKTARGPSGRWTTGRTSRC